MRKILILSALITQVACMTASNADNSETSKQYVEGLDKNCLYEDGYSCAVAGDTSFIQQTIKKQLTQAQHLEYWTAAYNAFLGLTELTDQQKDLKHYKVGFVTDNDQIIVYFAPLMMPYIENGKPAGISRVGYGKAVKIWLNKTNKEMNKYQLLK